MKLTLGKIRSISISINTLLSKELPIKSSYKFSKLAKKLSEEDEFFNKKHIEIINKYGVKNEEGNLNITDEGKVSIIEGQVEICQKELNELSEVEVEIIFEPVKIEELGDIKISPIDLLNLEDFIIE